MAINRIVSALVRTFWAVVILLVLAAAAYQSLGRVMLPRLHQYHQGIEEQISQTLGVPVSIASISGDWQHFQPVVKLNQVYLNSTSSTPIVIRRLHLQLNVVASLLAREPIFTTLIVDGARVNAARAQDKSWQLAGLALEDKPNKGSQRQFTQKNILQLLQNQRHVEITNSVVNFRTDTDEQAIKIDDWSFKCLAVICAVEGQITFEEKQDATLKFSGNIRNLSNPKLMGLDAYLELDPLRLEHWLQLLDIDTPVDLSFERFQLGGKVWLQWQDGRPNDIRGSLYVPDLKLVPGGEELNPVEFISSDFVWQLKPGDNQELWAVWLNDFTFSWQGEVFEPAQQRWSMLEEEGDKKIRVIADALDLEFTNNTLLAIEQLPNKLRKVLETLKPQGRLVNAHVTYALPQQQDAAAPLDVLLEANLYNVGVSAWMNAPSIEGLDGYILVKPQGGSVEFESKDLKVHFPKLYSEGMNFDLAHGAVSWKNRGEAVWMESDLITLSGEVGTVFGEFLVESPRDGAEPRFEMLIGLQDAPLTHALALVPDKRIDKHLNNWLLQGVQGGIAEEGYFLFSGSLRKGAPRSVHSLQLKMNVTDATLSYHEDWPAITDLRAQLDITQTSAEIYRAQGQLLGLDLPAVTASWVNSGGRGKVNIEANVRGPANDGLKLLTDTPIRRGIFDLIDDFSATGVLEADLQLGIPISEPEQTQVNLQLSATEVGLGIESLELEFIDVSGDFNYRSSEGISGATTHASLFGEPIEVVLESTPVTQDESRSEEDGNSLPYQTSLQLNGRVSAESIQQWQQIPLLERLSGVADYDALLEVGGDKMPTLTVTSSLKGIEIQAPAPLNKGLEESTDFAYVMEFDQETIHRIQYADLIDTALVLEGEQFTRGEIRFGSGRALLEDSPGIHLRGTIDALDLFEWWDFFEQVAGLTVDQAQAIETGNNEQPNAHNADQESSLAPDQFQQRLKEIELTVGALSIDDQILADLNLRMEQIDGDWWAQLENETLNGKIRIFVNQAKPATVELDYLKLPRSEEGSDPLMALYPQQIPAFDFTVKQLSLGQEEYGQWVFNYRPFEGGARLEQLVADIKGIEVNGELVWSYEDDSHRSQFVGSAHSSDLNKTMTAWGYPNTLEGKSLNLQADLKWQGTPAWGAPERLVGPLNISAKEGRFVDLESAPAALKLFGLFNLSAVARRIRLDFSDITKSGYSYDEIEGALYFDGGTVSTTDSLLINGPSAKFKLDGTTDLNNQQLDQNLVVVLPLSDNIPIAATVLGAPQVGIPLWLLNKAFGNMFETFTSAEYKVTGPISEPNIEGIRRYEKRMSETAEKASAIGEVEQGAAAEPAPN